MSDEKIGMEPAFPMVSENETNPIRDICEPGISKRLWIATQLLPSIIAGYVQPEMFLGSSVKTAYRAADELLKQEQE